jgi:hypothetical protein
MSTNQGGARLFEWLESPRIARLGAGGRGSNPSIPTITSHRYYKRYGRFRPHICVFALHYCSQFCNSRHLRDKSGESQVDFPLVNSQIPLAGISCIVRRKTTSRGRGFWFGTRFA